MFPFFEYLLYNSYAKDIKKGFEMDKLKIAIGSDHGGFRYKGIIEEYLKSKGVELLMLVQIQQNHVIILYMQKK